MAVSRAFFITTLLFILFNVTHVKAQDPFANYITPPATCINVKLPITFSWVDYGTLPEELPTAVKQKIYAVVIESYLESNGGDSSNISGIQNCYFNTLRAPFNNMQLIIVIMKTPTFQHSRCKLFLYDPATGAVSTKAIDYNTGAMYEIEEGRMRRSELFKEFRLDSDDIIQPKGKKPTLLVKRLKNTGRYNDLEETVYRSNGVVLDTVSYKKKPLD